jgi:CO dehydrogenase maturation factor
MRILVGGKGGTGKTVVSGLVVRSLVERGVDGPILGVDADADSNLGETLGVEVESTLGQVREDLFEQQGQLGPEVDKRIWLESRIYDIMSEGGKFDVLTMGRPEGPGCYCAVNNILRALLDTLSSSYPYVVIDAEAGLEHLSRRTTLDVDEVVLVTDLSMKGFRTARRMVDLAEGLGSRFGRFHLVANRVVNGNDAMSSLASSVGLDVDLAIPQDQEVTEADVEGRSVFTLSKDSIALKTVRSFVEEEILEGG